MFVTISVVIVSLVLIYGIFIERFQVETTHISFGSNLGIKFVHITDLHFSRESIREKKVLEILKEGVPDVIFITGDIVNYRRKFVASNYLKKIVDLGKPVYFVLGNWDYKVKDVENLKKRP
jgi:predicted MPP superfamily phosphohydrolase